MKVANTPPMGWNSWDCYGASITEKELLGNADYMAKHLKQYGWEYVVCDIQWYEPDANSTEYRDFVPLDMDEYGRLIPSVKRFPSAKDGFGFQAIADYIHGLGLKFGIHIMRGIPRQAVHANTPIKGSAATARQVAQRFSVCSWNTDMYGVDPSKYGAQAYYNSLFELYAQWGVDFVKVDDICNTFFTPHNLYSAKEEIRMIREAIDGCGRDMVLSLSPGPADIQQLDHLQENANMWRMTGDFWDDWKDLFVMFGKCKEWQGVGKAGAWPDCDMLPVGTLNIRGNEHGLSGVRSSRYTQGEQRMLLSLWCIFRSPLMIGGELTLNDAFTQSLLTNEAVLRILNHSSGAKEVLNDNMKIVWKTTDEDGSVYVALFNAHTIAQHMQMSFAALGLSADQYTVTDLWRGESLGIKTDAIDVVVPSHDVALFKFKAEN